MLVTGPGTHRRSARRLVYNRHHQHIKECQRHVSLVSLTNWIQFWTTYTRIPCIINLLQFNQTHLESSNRAHWIEVKLELDKNSMISTVSTKDASDKLINNKHRIAMKKGPFSKHKYTHLIIFKGDRCITGHVCITAIHLWPTTAPRDDQHLAPWPKNDPRNNETTMLSYRLWAWFRLHDLHDIS